MRFWIAWSLADPLHILTLPLVDYKTQSARRVFGDIQYQHLYKAEIFAHSWKQISSTCMVQYNTWQLYQYLTDLKVVGLVVRTCTKYQNMNPVIIFCLYFYMPTYLFWKKKPLLPYSPSSFSLPDREFDSGSCIGCIGRDWCVDDSATTRDLSIFPIWLKKNYPHIIKINYNIVVAVHNIFRFVNSQFSNIRFENIPNSGETQTIFPRDTVTSLLHNSSIYIYLYILISSSFVGSRLVDIKVSLAMLHGTKSFIMHVTFKNNNNNILCILWIDNLYNAVIQIFIILI